MALGFMQRYVALKGDHSPDNERIWLPVGMTIKKMYLEYVTSLDCQGNGFSWFLDSARVGIRAL